MRRRSLAMFVALLGCSAAMCAIDGCTIVNGLTVPEDAAAATDAPPPPDEGGDAPPIDGCNHARPPPPPKTSDGPENLSVVVVAKQILLSPDPTGDPVGYDLDDKCSGPETCVGEKPHEDPGGRGVDNNAGSLFTLVNGRTDLEQRVNDGILLGGKTILLRITGYNGKADDPAVTISLYTSQGLFDGSGNNVAPAFVESEAWSLDQSQFSAIAPDLPKATTQGYVANGIVVGSLSASVALSASFSVTFNAAYVTAELDLTGAKPTIKSGIIAGRWPVADILRVIARLRTSDGGKPLCNDATNYAFAKKIICDDLDIRGDRADDGKMLPCNATSAAIRIMTAPASLGAHRTEPPDEPCPGFPADDCKDGG